MSTFGNNENMIRNFAEDSSMDNLLKMTNKLMFKLKQEIG